jgi:hypothetical protein
MNDSVTEKDLLQRIARDIQGIKSQLAQVLTAIAEAESEVPEKMRRFMMYFHDLHDIRNTYIEHGLAPPAYVDREMERCDDRFRHLLEDQFSDTGAFEKVRQEMSQRAGNRWDHTRLLPKETKHETRPSDVKSNGIDQGGTETSSN